VTQAHLLPPDVYVADTGTAKGRGVFAARAFLAGQTVEIAPVVVFTPGNDELPDSIKRILFNWGHFVGIPGLRAIALGYGSLYNHDDSSNLNCEANDSQQQLRFIALRDIAAGEELTINYDGGSARPEGHKETWFKRLGVTKIE
jgi:hypothetical protein